MPLWSLTYEKVEELKKILEKKENEWKHLNNTTPEELWKTDLSKFTEILDKVEE